LSDVVSNTTVTQNVLPAGSRALRAVDQEALERMKEKILKVDKLAL